MRDRNIHNCILTCTTLLPYAVRVRARRYLLAALQKRLLRRADVVLIRHPKTGGTWLRVMLTRLYALKYGLPDRRVIRSDELRRHNAALPRLLVTSGYLSWERLVADAYTRRDAALAGRRTVFIARHPGDIAVSWFLQYIKRNKAFKRELIEHEIGAVNRAGITRFEFVQHPHLGLPMLIDYHNLWARALRDRSDARIVRYEDLRADTAATLRGLTEFMGESFTDAQIADAVDFASVENLRAKEYAGYFKGSSMRLRDPADPETLKVRRARPGGFRDDLTPEQVAWVDAQIRTRLDPVFGYGAPAPQTIAPPLLELR